MRPSGCQAFLVVALLAIVGLSADKKVNDREELTEIHEDYIVADNGSGQLEIVYHKDISYHVFGETHGSEESDEDRESNCSSEEAEEKDQESLEEDDEDKEAASSAIAAGIKQTGDCEDEKQCQEDFHSQKKEGDNDSTGLPETPSLERSELHKDKESTGSSKVAGAAATRHSHEQHPQGSSSAVPPTSKKLVPIIKETTTSPSTYHPTVNSCIILKNINTKYCSNSFKHFR